MFQKKIKKTIKSILKNFGYTISKVENKDAYIVENKFTMAKALKRCQDRGLKIKTVIDVGASNGIWSRECIKHFPDSNFLLVEAQEAHLQGLMNFKNTHLNVDFIIAAAGNTDGKIYFDNTGLFGGFASKVKLEKNCIEVPMIKLDSVVKKRKLEGPYLLKLDTHGFEIPILEGAKELIKKSELVIIETYNYKLAHESLKFFEMCNYMEKLGFSPIEMVDFMLRKRDNSFWQMDTFFIPSTNKSFSYRGYE